MCLSEPVCTRVNGQRQCLSHGLVEGVQETMASGHAQEIVLPWLQLFLEGTKQKTGWREGLVETLWDGITHTEVLYGCHLIKVRAGPATC